MPPLMVQWLKALARISATALAFMPGQSFADPQSASPAPSCRVETFDGVSFSLCQVHVSENLQLFLNDTNNETYGGFRAINRELAKQGKTLGFAMNAGMYHRDYRPVGAYIENGQQLAPLVTREGPGNFGMLPNGVFCWTRTQFHLIESRRFADQPPACDFATQSGPMLVIEGELHPRFLPDSDSTYIRNGVGIDASGQVAWFVMSDDAVNFHHFARFFRDHLGAPNALYFDGNISRLYAPELRRNDLGFPMGPIVGSVINKE